MVIKPIANPPNPFASSHVEWLDCAPPAKLQVFEEHCKSIVATNDSPDIGFEFSVNPYRGCFHACAYCYARPGHQFLDFGAGTDFETKLVAKVNAPEKLRESFMKKSWQGDSIVFSGVTDCYQPLEASYELTRGCLAVCAEFNNPAAIITKSALIRRDIELLQRLDRCAGVKVNMSIAFSDDEISKAIEPQAPRPSIRFRAMKELTDAGIPVGVGIAPVIPGLNDSQIAEILERAKECGASSAFMTLLRLPGEVKEIFLERLAAAFPSRFRKIVSQLTDLRGGAIYNPEFGKRMRGDGPRWQAIEFMFDRHRERLELTASRRSRAPRESKLGFRRPTRQMGLF